MQEINETLTIVTELIAEDEFEQIDLGLRITRYILELIDEMDSALARSMHPMVPLLFPVLFEAFTKEEIGVRGRE